MSAIAYLYKTTSKNNFEMFQYKILFIFNLLKKNLKFIQNSYFINMV